MMRSLSPRVEAAFWLLLTALGYFMLAMLSLMATKGADNIAAIWPPSGYFLALLLLMPARARPAAFLGAVTASMSANWLGGTDLWRAAAFTLANSAEAMIALLLIRRKAAGELSFMVPRSVGNFCAAALLASVASAVIAAVLTRGGMDFALSWLTTVALGMLIVSPPIIMLARLFESGAVGNVRGPMLAEAVTLLGITAGVTAVSFSQSHFPLTFVPCIAVMIASYRLGPFGAASAMLMVAIVSAWLTGQGHGPIAVIDGSQKEQVFFLQFYLVTMLFAALPLAALLVVHRRLAKRLKQSNHWLLQAEAAAHVGHWRVDLVRRTIQWSDQAYRIHGREPGTAGTIEESLACYVAEDSERVKTTLAAAVEGHDSFEFQGRIMRPDGDMRHVKSHGSIERNRNGRATGIFGTIQDVTQTVENARFLEVARNAAEEAANTDMLTGLPNRRQTLTVLQHALARARDEYAPLAVAIFDIDHFKRINDEYGHAVGDAVIRRVGRCGKAALRADDMVGRFGGEEFVCIFRGPSAKAATLAAERVRKAIENDSSASEEAPGVTVSIGLAVYSGETTAEELLHRADKALYHAKNDGRNRLRTAA